MMERSEYWVFLSGSPSTADESSGAPVRYVNIDEEAVGMAWQGGGEEETIEGGRRSRRKGKQ